jgi:DNA-binding transcriptional LysR family regulator
MLDWDKIKLFYQVATAGSITTAAERLNISQPALSRSILTLEARLKTKLFNRHKRGITLTRHGEILFRGAHKMFLESRHMEQAMHEGNNEVEGELTIITTPAIAATWLMKYLPGFVKKYPALRLKVIGQEFDGDTNYGDVYIMTHLPHEPTLVQEYLTTFSMRLFASQNYIDEFGIPKDAEELDNHRLISFNTGTLNSLDHANWILKVGHNGGTMREPYMEFNSAASILRAGELGLGIVELGKGYPELEGIELIEVLPALKGPIVDIFYIYQEHKKNVKKVTALLQYITELNKAPSSNSQRDKLDTVTLTKIG